MISPLEGSTIHIKCWIFKMAFLCKQPLLLLFAKTRQSRNKTQNILIYFYQLLTRQMDDLALYPVALCIGIPFHAFERHLLHFGVIVWCLAPPSALLMAPFCCAALIIQGVPPDIEYQNEQQITQPTKSFTALVCCNSFSFWYWKLGGTVIETPCMTQCKIELTYASHCGS